MEIVQAVKKLNSISRERLNFRRWPFLCTTLYRNPMQASNFGGTFYQLFLRIVLQNFHKRCLSTSSIPWCKKSQKWPKTQIKGGGCYLEASKKKKKEEGKKSMEDLAASVSPVIRKARCQTSKDWSPMIAKLQLFELETVVDIQRKENWVASSLFFFFEESDLECWEKRKVKVTENCVENTDFAYAAISRPGHMLRQLPARLSGIRSIGHRHSGETKI